MRFSTIHLDELPGTPAGAAQVAVVIDVIRAFTAAPWCIARGARELLLAHTVDDAVEAGRQRPEALLLKDGAPDPRFALSNAPGRIAREDLTERVVVQRTGNGTRGAHAVSAIGHVLCASFVTASATARAIAATEADHVLLVPTEGDEDRALAEYLQATLLEGPVDAEPYLSRVARSPAADELRTYGPDPSRPGIDPDDLARCLEFDRFEFALRARPSGSLLRMETVH